jgi:hypothetical protein
MECGTRDERIEKNQHKRRVVGTSGSHKILIFSPNQLPSFEQTLNSIRNNMVAKKYITFPVVCLTFFCASVGNQPKATVLTEESSTQTTTAQPASTENTLPQTPAVPAPSKLDDFLKNNPVYLGFAKTAAGVAVCLLPSVKPIRWAIGAALFASGAYDLKDKKEVAKETAEKIFLDSHTAVTEVTDWLSATWNKAKENTAAKKAQAELEKQKSGTAVPIKTAEKAPVEKK